MGGKLEAPGSRVRAAGALLAAAFSWHSADARCAEPAKNPRAEPSGTRDSPSTGAAASPPAPASGARPPPSFSIASLSDAELKKHVDQQLGKRTNDRGQKCEFYDTARFGEKVLAACGNAGAWVVSFDGSGNIATIETSDFEGEVVGVFSEGGQLWVKLSRLEARPFHALAHPRSEGEPLLSPSPAPRQPAATLPANAGDAHPGFVEGRVVDASSPEEVIIDLGSTDGLGAQQSVEFLTKRQAKIGDETTVRFEQIAVGWVVDQGSEFSRVKLGLNERVPPDAVVRPLAHSGRPGLVAPSHPVGWEAEANVRPFIVLGELGGGLLFTGSAGYRHPSHWHVWLDVDPVGVSDVENDDALLVAAGRVLFSYDSHIFEIGAGIGAQTVNNVDAGLERGSGFQVSQLVRFGAVDGLRLTLRSDVVLFHSEFDFSGLTGEGQIPVGFGAWLILRGGGGSTGYAFGELGLKVLLHGNGTGGSLFLTVEAGGASLTRSDEFIDTGIGVTSEAGLTQGGPLAGVGIGSRW